MIEIDITKYNFILTDGLTLQRLNDEFFWILNADIRNAVIGLEEITEINGQLVTSIDTPTVPVETSDIEEQTQEIIAQTDITDGANVSAVVAQESLILRKQVLRWYEGDWICGTWEDGVWYSGEVYAIKWIKGQWFAHPAVNNYNVWTIDLTVDDKELSVWNKGEWGSGIWYNGIWYDGIWYGGSHIAGDWFNGEWLDGEWLDGSWSGGTWSDGTWLDGIWNADNVDSIWENGTWLGGDFENGVWNNGIWDQGADKTSRFGTKSTSVQQSIWKFGIWKNGEFHNYLTQNEEGEPIASESYKYSKWLNGIWLAGNWYGGTWSSGRWENGVWHYGFWRSQQRLKYVELIQTEVEGE
ncbi:MAG: hypothetical protein ACC656_14405, partial [Candidatus Heimdallarchaeota archaeon]